MGRPIGSYKRPEEKNAYKILYVCYQNIGEYKETEICLGVYDCLEDAVKGRYGYIKGIDGKKYTNAKNAICAASSGIENKVSGHNGKLSGRTYRRTANGLWYRVIYTKQEWEEDNREEGR